MSRTARIRLKISCNGEEVLNLLLDDVCTYGTWSKHWDKDIELIQIISSDDATDFYRPSKARLSLAGDYIKKYLSCI